MKYIPGSAKFSIKPKEESGLKNIYEVYVECDANDGDYVNRTETKQSFTEKEILLLAYLSINEWRTSESKWEDVKKIKDPNYPFGGKYVGENDRFDTDEFSLSEWSSENDILLFCGAIDDTCHSVETIAITYYDENGTEFTCELPDLYELFDSEEEFIEYIKSLKD